MRMVPSGSRYQHRGIEEDIREVFKAAWMRSSRASFSARSQSASGAAAPQCTHSPSTFIIERRCPTGRKRTPPACSTASSFVSGRSPSLCLRLLGKAILPDLSILSVMAHIIPFALRARSNMSRQPSLATRRPSLLSPAPRALHQSCSFGIRPTATQQLRGTECSTLQ